MGPIAITTSANPPSAGLPFWDPVTLTSGPVLSMSNALITSSGGPNAANGTVAGIGAVEGPFTATFALSYSWGWGQAGVAAIQDFNSNGTLVAERSFFVSVYNNNSNNWAMIDITINGVYSRPVTVTGYSSGSFIIKRETNNNITVTLPTGSPYSLGTYSGTMKFYAMTQSPGWVQFVSLTMP